jgi:hypothetical protein
MVQQELLLEVLVEAQPATIAANAAMAGKNNLFISVP